MTVDLTFADFASRTTSLPDSVRSLVRAVLAPRGEPSNPLTWEDRKQKFDGVALKRMSAAAAAASVEGVTAMEAEDIRPLLSILATPLVKEVPDIRSSSPLARARVSG